MLQRSLPLLGGKTIEYLAKCHIAVFGIGGVGGFVVEGLVRQGVGEFSLFDFDEVAVSNKNRQIIALDSTMGQMKVEAMKKRILDINKDAKVHTYPMKIDEESIQSIDFSLFDYVVDCIDDVPGKIAIIKAAKHALIPIISSCGTGNKLNPLKFQITDISKTSICPLAKKLRHELKIRNIKDVKVLYSKEEPITKADFIPSVSFVPSVAGLLIAREVVLDIHQLVIQNRIHLVLEGGGMKGVYTCGALDCLLDHDIQFDAIYGVSAGACSATSFLSKQKSRSFHAMTDYIGNPEYASKRSLAKTGNYFNKEFVYRLLPDELIPFDYDTAFANPCKLFAVVTNVETGKAEYHECIDYHTEIDYVCASSSLPLLAEIQWIDGKGYLDGGLSDAIPIAEAKKNALRTVVILTKPQGYQCEPQSSILLNAMKLKYRKYPELLKTIEHRHLDYNQSLKKVENDKNTFVIRPSKDLNISRLESDKSKLKELYKMGYQDTKRLLTDLKEFMK